MFFVVGVLELVEEVWVSIGATSNLRAGRPVAFHTSRVIDAFFNGQGLLDLDGVCPIVPKVIIVTESRMSLLDKIAESNGTGIVFEVTPTFQIAVLLTIDHEGEHMFVVPAHAIWMMSCSSSRVQSSICTRRQIAGMTCRRLIFN